MKNDLKGQKFGRLLVLEEAGRTPGRQVVWSCQCDCGNYIKVRAQDLRNGHTKSCGCYKKEKSTQEKKKKKNKVEIKDNIVFVYHPQSERPFLIDVGDYDKIKDYYWRITFQQEFNYYCVETKIKKKQTKLSRYLLGITDKNIYVDHINGDSLDNRRSNLRIASPHQNSMNRVKVSKTRLYKGVNQNSNRWVAHIGYTNSKTGVRKNIYLGSFKTPEEAAKAYDKKAIELFGEFARLNFPMKFNDT